jgi:hypothetical protein
LRSRRDAYDFRRASLKARRRMPMPTRTPYESRKLWHMFPAAWAAQDSPSWQQPRSPRRSSPSSPSPPPWCLWSSSIASRSRSSASRRRRAAATGAGGGGGTGAGRGPRVGSAPAERSNDGVERNGIACDCDLGPWALDSGSGDGVASCGGRVARAGRRHVWIWLDGK